MKRLENFIKSKINDDVEVKYTEIKKNNGTIRKGFIISKTENSINPVIYYDEDDSDEDIVNHIVELYFKNLNNPTNKYEDTAKSIISCAENVYKNVFPVLINHDKNINLLDNVVHIPFLDMEIIFKIKIFNTEEEGVGSIIVNKDLAESLNLVEDTLLNSAISNNFRNNIIISMSEIISKMIGDDEEEVPDEKFEEDFMYIVSNKERLNGASVILYNSVLDKLHEKLGDDIIILPSSIHEIIAIPYPINGLSKHELKKMVSIVNITRVAEDEILSDSVYLHNVADGWKIL